jgi:hypothetical protein
MEANRPRCVQWYRSHRDSSSARCAVRDANRPSNGSAHDANRARTQINYHTMAEIDHKHAFKHLMLFKSFNNVYF